MLCFAHFFFPPCRVRDGTPMQGCLVCSFLCARLLLSSGTSETFPEPALVVFENLMRVPFELSTDCYDSSSERSCGSAFPVTKRLNLTPVDESQCLFFLMLHRLLVSLCVSR
uniref:Putative secreted protein n=1 Tax=Rhipicephalus microplus TaxID=6941 RepID=A0A6M2DCQ6_RHIMP